MIFKPFDYPHLRVMECKEEWSAVGRSTQPANRPAAEAGIRHYYRTVQLPEPSAIVWCSSPIALEITARSIDCLCRESDPNRSIDFHAVEEVLGREAQGARNSVKASALQSILSSLQVPNWWQVWAEPEPTLAAPRFLTCDVAYRLFAHELMEMIAHCSCCSPYEHPTFILDLCEREYADEKDPRPWIERLEDPEAWEQVWLGIDNFASRSRFLQMHRSAQSLLFASWRNLMLPTWWELAVRMDDLLHRVAGFLDCRRTSTRRTRNPSSPMHFGQDDAPYLAGLELLAASGASETMANAIAGVVQVAKNAGWYLPRAGGCWISERRSVLKYVRSDLGCLPHCVDGPAIAYPDGASVYCFDGTPFRRHIMEHPKRITREEILAQSNYQVRRFMIERYCGTFRCEDICAESRLELRRLMLVRYGGLLKYFMDFGAKVVHQDDWGALYQRSVFNRGEPIAFVKVVNATPEPDGTFKDYMLRVPPDMRTARQAVAWTFGKEEHEYSPTAQT